MNILVKMTTILIICFLSFPIEAQDNLTITIIVDEASHPKESTEKSVKSSYKSTYASSRDVSQIQFVLSQ